jgi:hypothetical protein
MYLNVVCRPLPAAPLAVRCMYMAVVPRLTCGSMLEVSRDAAAAGEEKLVSSAA